MLNVYSRGGPGLPAQQVEARYDASNWGLQELPGEIRRDIDDWFRCIGGALVEQDFLARLQSNGLINPRVLWLGRNARTGHELARCAVIRADKPAASNGD